MVYTSRQNARVIEFGTKPVIGTPVIDSTAGDIGPITFNLPAFTGLCEWAYFDLNFGTIVNTHAGDNRFTPEQYIYVRAGLGTWKMAIVIYNGSCVLPNGGFYVGRVFGSIDIKDVINTAGSGGSCQWQWTDSQTEFDTFYLDGYIQGIIRMNLK